MGFIENLALYAAGVVCLLTAYLAFSPVTRDLVVFLSRDAQITIYRHRHLLWLAGTGCLLLLAVRVVYGFRAEAIALEPLGRVGAGMIGTAETGWFWVLAVTVAVLSVAYWATYVPVVMAPPKIHRTISAKEAESLLNPDSMVLGLVMDDVVRAYPRDLIARPHWFNDIIAGKPLMISYCILCNSGQAFVPVLGNGRRLDLRNMTAFDNNTIYYDVNSGNFIQQLEGKVISGPDKGEALEAHPLVMARWSDWKSLHPDTTVYYAPPVTARDRVVQKMLDTMIPITKLAARARPWHLVRKPLDERLPCMSFVFGVEINNDVCAYPVAAAREARAINDSVGGEPIVLLYDSRHNVGQPFSRRIDGRELTFVALPNAESGKAVAKDEETGSLWDVTGHAIEGTQVGRSLQTVSHYNQLFWFSWAAFKPKTRVNWGTKARRHVGAVTKSIAA